MRIKMNRLQLGWTLKDLSIAISDNLNDGKTISESIVSRWENGISLPTAKRLKAVSYIFNMTVFDLLR